MTPPPPPSPARSISRLTNVASGRRRGVPCRTREDAEEVQRDAIKKINQSGERDHYTGNKGAHARNFESGGTGSFKRGEKKLLLTRGGGFGKKFTARD